MEKKINRTIESTKAVVMYANIDNNTFEEKEVILSGIYASEKELIKNVERTENLIPLKVVSTERIIKKYSMTISDFIKYATSVKDVDENETEVEDTEE